MKKFILAFSKYSAENPEIPETPTPDTVQTFKITEFTGGGINDEWIGTYEKGEFGYWQQEDDLCYLQYVQSLYDKGPAWVFYNENYTTNPYYFTRNENPFTTTEWKQFDDDTDPETVTFSDFTY